MLKSLLRYLGSLAVLLAFLLLGTLLGRAARLPLPGSVLGMVLLAAALHVGVVPLRWVRPAADLLIRHMALLFVPPGVGLMLHFGVLRREWLAIGVACFASTVAVLLAVGWLQQRLERHG